MMMEKGRRQLRALAQWVNLVLEPPGETQARVLHLVRSFRIFYLHIS